MIIAITKDTEYFSFVVSFNSSFFDKFFRKKLMMKDKAINKKHANDVNTTLGNMNL